MSCKFKILRAAALTGASLLCMSGAAAAQTQANTQVAAAVGEPERVLITGYLEQDLPQRLAELGTRVDIVTSIQIQNAGYLDIGQTLSTLVPGLYIAQKNGPFDYVDISLQGSRTEDVLWIYDGVRINNRLYGSTTPLDTLPASMIERV